MVKYILKEALAKEEWLESAYKWKTGLIEISTTAQSQGGKFYRSEILKLVKNSAFDDPELQEILKDVNDMESAIKALQVLVNKSEAAKAAPESPEKKFANYKFAAEELAAGIGEILKNIVAEEDVSFQIDQFTKKQPLKEAYVSDEIKAEIEQIQKSITLIITKKSSPVTNSDEIRNYVGELGIGAEPEVLGNVTRFKFWFNEKVYNPTKTLIDKIQKTKTPDEEEAALLASLKSKAEAKIVDIDKQIKKLRYSTVTAFQEAMTPEKASRAKTLEKLKNELSKLIVMMGQDKPALGSIFTEIGKSLPDGYTTAIKAAFPTFREKEAQPITFSWKSDLIKSLITFIDQDIDLGITQILKYKGPTASKEKSTTKSSNKSRLKPRQKKDTRTKGEKEFEQAQQIYGFTESLVKALIPIVTVELKRNKHG